MVRLNSGWVAILASVSSVATVTASPITWDYHRCFSFMADISITNTTTVIPGYPPFADGIAATNFFNLDTLRDGDSSSLSKGETTIDYTFDISFQYCIPKDGASVLQILTHGIGFDKTYWDFQPPIDTNISYSYVSAALEQGYAVLSYDRIGTGHSTVVDPYNMTQVPVEVAILEQLTSLARTGKLHSDIAIPKKVVHVGHSLGSLITNALVAVAPESSDGIILTSFTHNSSYMGLFAASANGHLASENQPDRFSNRSTGFLTWPDKYANQYSFFAYPEFDPEVLTYVEETKWPFAISELTTFTTINLVSQFKGPVLFLAAEKDLIFCGSDCHSIIASSPVDSISVNPATIKPADYHSSASPLVYPTNAIFAQASSVDVYIQPLSGHALNLHRNATGAYGVMLDWVHKTVQ